ncbi:hypothetical protein OIU77_004196 [Salix suchowensis]|uniref:Uncharacterized protein n=1 Tax=Salix suchowensis TaxID=1278906 RepID=A0ABQ9ATK0_9ROSI|nr:hypothetical protein OIU77_004196 [Salix suchowensis]KAJ6384184.1 hypothetical protein OIU78_027482 [Salix suchowensis]
MTGRSRNKITPSGPDRGIQQSESLLRGYGTSISVLLLLFGFEYLLSFFLLFLVLRLGELIDT